MRIVMISSLAFSLFLGGNGFAFEPLFHARIEYPAGHWPVSTVSEDFDGDGHLDLGVANWHGEVSIYDLLGRQVRTLLDEYRQADIHHVAFDASDLASGIYFYHLQAGESVDSRRMTLLK